jgi:hypothetical protein
MIKIYIFQVHSNLSMANACLRPSSYDAPPLVLEPVQIDEDDNLYVVDFYHEYINPTVIHDNEVNSELFLAVYEWDDAPMEKKQRILQGTHSISTTVPRALTTTFQLSGGERYRSISQHPILALSKEIRAICLQGYYHYNKFETRFNLSMGKFDVSEVSHMAEMLPLNLLQAVFKTRRPVQRAF